MHNPYPQQQPVPPPVAPPPPRSRGHNVLVNLAAPLLELTLKLKTGDIRPSMEVRRVAGDLLRQLGTSAEQLGVPHRQAQDIKYALVAFVDETILQPDHRFALRDEWEKYPLQLEHFNDNYAGERFFERLDALMRGLDTEADVAEVYYLCLLLGYRGKYSVSLLAPQLPEVIRRTGEALRRVGRLKNNALSAHWQATDRPAPPRDPGIPLWVKIGGPALVAFALVVYAVLYFLLRNDIVLER
ncbi:MAG TPA: type IVB secretion system protein IcmH/DotU [Pyrinomonadaceae bacterium]|nr:type IVB secretion system protein IcmH/DotU [Pyrinomonadaceae bacterium]